MSLTERKRLPGRLPCVVTPRQRTELDSICGGLIEELSSPGCGYVSECLRKHNAANDHNFRHCVDKVDHNETNAAEIKLNLVNSELYILDRFLYKSRVMIA